MTEQSEATTHTGNGRVYEAPSATRLPVGQTLGGTVSTCDTQCEVADNTFPASS